MVEIDVACANLPEATFWNGNGTRQACQGGSVKLDPGEARRSGRQLTVSEVVTLCPRLPAVPLSVRV